MSEPADPTPPTAPPGFDDVRRAAVRIGPWVHHTPVLTCAALDRMAGARLHFKCESFQKGGAFKARGAHNAVFSLSDREAAAGVVTHSSGNHGAALALAAAHRGVPARVVMPRDAPRVKRAAVAGYGAEIVLCEPTAEARREAAERVRRETGATLVHPFDDPRVIAGQGTAALELFEQAAELGGGEPGVAGLDYLLVPVGGGGLAAGTAVAAAGASPATRVVGCEPAAADDAARSLAAGRLVPNPPGPVDTVADGLRTSLSELTFSVLAERLERVVTVSEEAILRALRTVWERMKIVIEPSAAVPVAALLSGGAVQGWEGERPPRVGVILSGGNVDLDRLTWPPAEEG